MMDAERYATITQKLEGFATQNDALAADLKDVAKERDAFGNELSTVEALEKVNDISELTDSWTRLFYKWERVYIGILNLEHRVIKLNQAFEAKYLPTDELADVPKMQRIQIGALSDSITAVVTNINRLEKQHHEELSQTMIQLFNRPLDVMKRHAADAPDAKEK